MECLHVAMIGPGDMQDRSIVMNDGIADVGGGLDVSLQHRHESQPAGPSDRLLSREPGAHQVAICELWQMLLCQWRELVKCKCLRILVAASLHQVIDQPAIADFDDQSPAMVLDLMATPERPQNLTQGVLTKGFAAEAEDSAVTSLQRSTGPDEPENKSDCGSRFFKEASIDCGGSSGFGASLPKSAGLRLNAIPASLAGDRIHAPTEPPRDTGRSFSRISRDEFKAFGWRPQVSHGCFPDG